MELNRGRPAMAASGPSNLADGDSCRCSISGLDLIPRRRAISSARFGNPNGRSRGDSLFSVREQPSTDVLVLLILYLPLLRVGSLPEGFLAFKPNRSLRSTRVGRCLLFSVILTVIIILDALGEHQVTVLAQ